jgi:hypothetical protein
MRQRHSQSYGLTLASSAAQRLRIVSETVTRLSHVYMRRDAQRVG